jgi:hypothetical protein
MQGGRVRFPPAPQEPDFSEKAQGLPAKQPGLHGRGGPKILSGPPDPAAGKGGWRETPDNVSIIRPLSGLRRGGKKIFEKKFPVVFQAVMV